jgi:hypothetical protein
LALLLGVKENVEGEESFFCRLGFPSCCRRRASERLVILEGSAERSVFLRLCLAERRRRVWYCRSTSEGEVEREG